MKTEQRTIERRVSLSFGELLQRERRLRGLTLRDAAQVTKVSVRYLEALEHNDFETLPGGAYNKGFLRVYAQFIGLDPEEMVNHYLYEISQGQHETETAPGSRADRWRPVWRYALVAAGVLLLAAVLVWAFA